MELRSFHHLGKTSKGSPVKGLTFCELDEQTTTNSKGAIFEGIRDGSQGFAK